MSNTNVKSVNPMKVITGKDTRWSYANVWEAKSINGGTPKFSVSLALIRTSMYAAPQTSILHWRMQAMSES